MCCLVEICVYNIEWRKKKKGIEMSVFSQVVLPY